MNSSMKEQLQQWKEANPSTSECKTKSGKAMAKKQENYFDREWLSLMRMEMRTLRRGKGEEYKG